MGFIVGFQMWFIAVCWCCLWGVFPVMGQKGTGKKLTFEKSACNEKSEDFFVVWCVVKNALLLKNVFRHFFRVSPMKKGKKSIAPFPRAQRREVFFTL